MPDSATSAAGKRAPNLWDVTAFFLRLGTTAFGGPAAHIAMMEENVVRRYQWMTREEFLDLLGIVNLIPGPNSTEMAIQIGYRVAGWPGLALGGACFILPAAILTGMLAWVYLHYGQLPKAAGAFYGIKAVVIAVVLQAIWNLARTAVKNGKLAAIGLGAVLAAALGADVLLVLFGAGILVMLLDRRVPAERASGITAAAGITAAGAGSFGLCSLFLVFFKVGAVLFGSGYVLLAFLRADLVLRWHWLTDAQLLDAVAVGQMTPGPVFTTATFIGYLLGRMPGAAAATLGIFLPSFLLIALVGPLVPRLRGSSLTRPFLDGVNAGALALMLVVTWQLGRAAIVDFTTLALALVSLLLLLRFRINSAWLVLGGALAGALLSR
jgi:chromate transporter